MRGLPRKMFFADTTVIESLTQVAYIDLPRGYRFVIIGRDASPMTCPIDDPGTYEISFEALQLNIRLPIAVSVIRAKHVKMWEKLSPAAVNQMMDGVEQQMGRPKRAVLQ